MSTVSEREALRRALRLADGIEPKADGLQRIQARLQPPRPWAVASAETAWTYVRTRVPDDLQRLWNWLRSVASLGWERLGLNNGAPGHRASRASGWLRPAAVLGVTIFVVAVGTYVAIDGQQVFSPSASNALHNAGSGPGPGGSGGQEGTNAQSHSAFPRYSPKPSASSTCAPAKPGGSVSSPPTTGSTSPAASPSATSPSPSPSPTPTDSSSPAVSPAAQPNLPASGADAPATTADTVADLVVQSPASASPTPTPCATKRPHRSSGAITPHPSTAVITFGKLEPGN